MTLAARTSQRLAADGVARAHTGGMPVLLEQLDDLHAVRADRPEALGLAEHGEHEAHVVGLAVVEEVAGARLAGAQRGQQLDDLLAGDDAMTLRTPRGVGQRRLRARPSPAAPAQALAIDRHDVVQVEPDAHETVGSLAVEGRDDERQRVHEVRREGDHQLALEQRLADEAEIEVLQVAQAPVHELARAARGPARVVVALEQRDAVAARRGVEGDPGTGDAPADDDDVELLARERAEGVPAVDHPRQCSRAPRDGPVSPGYASPS